MSNPSGASSTLDLLVLAKHLNERGHRAFPVDEQRRPLITEYRGQAPISLQVLQAAPWTLARGVATTVSEGYVALQVGPSDRDFRCLSKLESVLGRLPDTPDLQDVAGTQMLFRTNGQVRGRVLAHRIVDSRGRGALRIGHARGGILMVTSVTDLELAVRDARPLPRIWNECLTIAKASQYKKLTTDWFGIEEDAVFVLQALANSPSRRAELKALGEYAHLGETATLRAVRELRRHNLAALIGGTEAVALFSDLPNAVRSAIKEFEYLDIARRSLAPAQGL